MNNKKTNLNPEVIYESALMSTVSYEDMIKLAQIYSVGKDITHYLADLIDKEVVHNQPYYEKILKSANPQEIMNEDGTFPYPLKPDTKDLDTFTYDIIIECLTNPERAEEYVGAGHDYDAIKEQSKTLKTITEEKKSLAKIKKKNSEIDMNSITHFQKMKMIITEFEPCDEIKLMIITHLENRNGGLSDEMKDKKKKITEKIKSFQTSFNLAGKEAEKQQSLIAGWNTLSDELCSFFLRSDSVLIDKNIQDKFTNGFEHIDPNGDKLNLTAKFENGHITIDDKKTKNARMSLYIRKSNTTIPPTLHIAFRGTENEFKASYFLNDYPDMKNHLKKMQPIIDEVIKQELKKHKEQYPEQPLCINWSGHSLGAACASLALEENKDSKDIVHTGAFFGMPKIMVDNKNKAVSVAAYLYEGTKGKILSDKSKFKKFGALGIEGIYNHKSNYKEVVDNRGVCIDQAGDFICSGRKLTERLNKQLRHPTVNIYKDRNRSSIDHHSKVDYALLTRNLKETFTLHNLVYDIKNNTKEAHNHIDFIAGNIEDVKQRMTNISIVERIAALRGGISGTQIQSKNNKV